MFSKRIALMSCLLVGALALGACSTAPRVRYDVDSHTNISNYHTYAWQRSVDDPMPGGAAFRNPLNQKRLRDAVEANLAKQGLQPAADGVKPDAYVSAAIGSRQTIETEDRMPLRFGYGLGWGYGRAGYGYMNSLMWDNASLYSYREGRVSVDLFDARKHEGIWHASVEQDLSYLTGDKAEARINQLVDAMFTKFPGASAKSAK